jgi:type IV secretory pathway VirB10-like protein
VAVPASLPVTRSKSLQMVVAIGAAVLIAGGLVMGGRALTPSTPPAPISPPPVAVTEPPTPLPAKPETAAPPVAPPVETTPPAPVIPTAEPSSSPRPGKTEVLAEPVRQQLEEAELALTSGDIDTAIRIARRTLQTQQTDAANLLIGRAYCHRQDLSNVNAQLRNLSKQGGTKLRAYCKKVGFNLGK